MIVLYMEGGLGNQLFNYAAARALADHHGVGLVIDASFYREQWHPQAQRPLLINTFPVRAAFRHMGPSPDKKNIFQRVYRRLSEDVFVRVINRHEKMDGELKWEKYFQYYPDFEKLGSRMRARSVSLKPRSMRRCRRRSWVRRLPSAPM